MEKQTEEMVEVRGREPLPKTAVEIVYSDYSQEYILKSEALENVAAQYGVVHNDFEDDFVYVDERDLKYHRNDTCWAGEFDQYVHENDVVKSWCETIGSSELFSESYDYNYVSHGQASGYYLYREDTIYCEDIGEYVHEDDAHYCERNDEYYYDEDQVCDIDESDRAILHEYHRGPTPLDCSEGAKFRIGFEIEKNKFLDEHYDVGDEIGEYSLIAKFETDSSCGYEAITHILPLSGVRSHRRRNVFNSIDEAEEIINSQSSKDCGGHITISVKDMDSLDLLEKIRGNLSILYALYRFRLNNSYCQHNKKLKKVPYRSRGVVTIKNEECIEIRLPNRVQNTRQLKLRYDLMYIIIRRSLEGLVYSQILKEVKPILIKMYNRDRAKVKDMIRLAKLFRKFIISDKIDQDIEKYINKSNEEE